MINIFDLSAGSKTPTEKVVPRDGSPTRQARSDTVVLHPVGSHIEGKQIGFNGRIPRNKSTSGTPMKKLIEEEMSKEAVSQKKPPSIVAKLMGLDALPANEPSPTKEKRNVVAAADGRTHRGAHSTSVAISDNKQAERRNGRNIKAAFRSHSGEHREYKDVYEVPPRTYYNNCMRPECGTRERLVVRPSEPRMELVREKFTEAKRLAANRSLLHSKEFQDAIEVLSSNRDVFLKFLEEPNSLFSEYVQQQEKVAPEVASQTRRITVLKPCNNNTAGGCYLDGQQSGGKPMLNCGDDKKKPTRIVVLKPSPSPVKPLDAEEEEEEEEEESVPVHGNRQSRHVVVEKEMMMRGGTVREDNPKYWYRRDETLLSSVVCNGGYTGDESSFNRSDCGYLEDGFDDDWSESDIPSPVTRHSWDCHNSPCSLSSFSRMSYSPESSVIREAKKRLSERWVMVTSNDVSKNKEEQKEVRRSVSTLGEMLASRDGVVMDAAGLCWYEEADVGSSWLSAETNTATTLGRSKSVPASSSSCMFGGEAEDVDDNKNKNKRSPLKEKVKSEKSSLKLKVSNFFFSRNKRSAQDKRPAAAVSQSANGDFSGKSLGGSCNLNEAARGGYPSVTTTTTTPCTSFNQAFGSSTEAALLIAKTSDKAGSAEPSPDSVLEAPFKEDDGNYGADMGSSRLISRSPPIGSIARSLPNDSSITGVPVPARHSAESEGHEREQFVRKLLSATGMCGDMTRSRVLTLWHSLDSPLSPSMLDRFLERKGEEARCRVRRSNQRLWFDSVNAALLELSWNSRGFVAPPCGGSVTRQVLGRLNEWWVTQGGGGWAPSSPCEQDTGQVVDRIVGREVRGGGWVEMGARELWELCGEVEEQLLHRLVEEILVYFNTTTTTTRLLQ